MNEQLLSFYLLTDKNINLDSFKIFSNILNRSILLKKSSKLQLKYIDDIDEDEGC